MSSIGTWMQVVAVGALVTQSTGHGPFIALVPATAQLLLRGGAGSTALLVTAQGAGAVVGSFALPVWRIGSAACASWSPIWSSFRIYFDKNVSSSAPRSQGL